MRMPRVLLSALIFSAVWHLFWISTLTVVVVPKDAKPPKFSSVSFLGPILGESILKVSSAVHERSIPEKRYLSEIEKLITSRSDLDIYAESDLDVGTDIFESDKILTDLAILAIDGDKMDPGNSQ